MGIKLARNSNIVIVIIAHAASLFTDIEHRRTDIESFAGLRIAIAGVR